MQMHYHKDLVVVVVRTWGHNPGSFPLGMRETGFALGTLDMAEVDLLGTLDMIEVDPLGSLGMAEGDL